MGIFAHCAFLNTDRTRADSLKRYDNYVVGVKATDVGRERICKLINNLELAKAQKLCHGNHRANARLQPTNHNAQFKLHKFLTTDPGVKKACCAICKTVSCSSQLKAVSKPRSAASTAFLARTIHERQFARVKLGICDTEDDSKHLKIDTSTPSGWPLIFNELVTTLQQP